jgi:hypothetical protein
MDDRDDTDDRYEAPWRPLGADLGPDRSRLAGTTVAGVARSKTVRCRRKVPTESDRLRSPRDRSQETSSTPQTIARTSKTTVVKTPRPTLRCQGP